MANKRLSKVKSQQSPWQYPSKNVLIRRPSDRKCKVVGTDTRTMRRYAYLQYYIKYCSIHLPTPCPSSTSPQLRSTFDAASWDDFCQMGVPLYWKYHKRAFGKLSLRKSAQLTAFKCLPFRSLGRQPSATSNKADLNEISQPCRRSEVFDWVLPRLDCIARYQSWRTICRQSTQLL